MLTRLADPVPSFFLPNLQIDANPSNITLHWILFGSPETTGCFRWLKHDLESLGRTRKRVAIETGRRVACFLLQFGPWGTACGSVGRSQVLLLNGFFFHLRWLFFWRFPFRKSKHSSRFWGKEAEQVPCITSQGEQMSTQGLNAGCWAKRRGRTRWM